MGKIFLAAGLFAVLLLTACGRPFKDDGRYAGFTRLQLAGQDATAFVQEGLDEFFAVARLGDKGLGLFAAPTINAMIFASDQNAFGHGGRLFLQASDLVAASPKTWLIPNSTYKFAMVGYDTAGMGTAPLCSMGDDGGGSTITLGGGVKTITFTSGTCDINSEFKAAQSYSNFKIAVCTAGSDLGTLTDPTDACPTDHASVQSLKVFVTGTDEFSGPNFGAFDPSGPASLSSTCTTVSAGLTGPSIFFLGGRQGTGVHLRAEVALFSDASCSTPHSMFEFRTGLSGATHSAGADVLMAISGGGGFAIAETKARWMDGSPGPRLYLNAP